MVIEPNSHRFALITEAKEAQIWTLKDSVVVIISILLVNDSADWHLGLVTENLLQLLGRLMDLH